MLDVDGRKATTATGGPAQAGGRGAAAPDEVANLDANAGLIGRWVTWSGVGVVALSAFGGVFPYYANGLGLSLDGAPDGAMTVWRTVLHLVPGVLGVVAGLAMVAWGRRRLTGRRVDAAQARLIGRATLVVGGWFAVGPYLYGVFDPSQAHGTGGHAGMVMAQGGSWLTNVMMPTFGAMKTMPSTVNCAFTMGICHWLVGGLIVFGGLVALGAGLGMGPVAGLSRAGLDDTDPTGTDRG